MKNIYIKKILLILFDALIIVLCSYLSVKIFNLQGDEDYSSNIVIYTFVMIAITLIVFIILHLYSSLWYYAGFEEMIKVFLGVLIVFVINALFSLITGFIRGSDTLRFIPIRWCCCISLLQFFFTMSSRFAARAFKFFASKRASKRNKTPKANVRVMIVGAGEAGLALIKEMKNAKELNMLPVCLIDDDKSKIGLYLEGVKIVGNKDDIPKVSSEFGINHIIIAIPSAQPSAITSIINICQDTNCKIQLIPGMYQIVKDTNLLKTVRNVEIQDLLGRDPIIVDLDKINMYLNNEVVLITGGGGSIGSELCRQIANSHPKQLIVFDCYENNAYDIEQELKTTHPELNLLALIGSVRDVKKLDDLFSKYHPDIVFHAAAHKHVPLMEESPNEAVKNNVFGTLNTVRMADKYKAKKFIMISTDKAVNPTNIMGATKRLCEMIVQNMDKHSETDFVCTRFGNVLGSNGSVIPLFKKQISNGGPVTVTHREITRFFMTIPEAVSLVLQAGSYAKGGEIFVLDMGKPVKIYDLAVNLIKLSGYTPNVDMKIKITGLRPGEKLYEEILMDEEGLQETENKLIHIGHPIEFNEETFFEELNELKEAVENENANIKELVAKLVSTYKKQD